jgi:hypothetical protein
MPPLPMRLLRTLKDGHLAVLRLRGHVTYLDDEHQSLYNQIFRGA